jgi:hypothetical protein
VLLHCSVEIQARRCESDLSTSSPVRGQPLSEGLEECDSGRGTGEGKGLQYNWDPKDGKCDERVLLG